MDKKKSKISFLCRVSGLSLREKMEDLHIQKDLIGPYKTLKAHGDRHWADREYTEGITNKFELGSPGRASGYAW